MTLILWAILFAQADAVVIQGSWWVWITLFRGDLCVELCAPYILRLFKFQIFCFLLEYVLQLHSKLWFSFHKIWSHKKMLWPPAAKNWFIWKDLDAGKDWKHEKTGDDRGWDGWMASPTQWTWVWVNSGSWWWTGRPGVLQSMVLQRVWHDWATKLNWRRCLICIKWKEIYHYYYYSTSQVCK